MPLALTQGASERYSLIFRVCKTYIPIDAATAAKVNSDQYCFVSKAQVAAGTPRPDAETLRAAAEADANAAAARDAAAGRQWPEVSRKAHNAAAKAAVTEETDADETEAQEEAANPPSSRLRKRKSSEEPPPPPPEHAAPSGGTKRRAASKKSRKRSHVSPAGDSEDEDEGGAENILAWEDEHLLPQLARGGADLLIQREDAPQSVQRKSDELKAKSGQQVHVLSSCVEDWTAQATKMVNHMLRSACKDDELVSMRLVFMIGRKQRPNFWILTVSALKQLAAAACDREGKPLTATELKKRIRQAEESIAMQKKGYTRCDKCHTSLVPHEHPQYDQLMREGDERAMMASMGLPFETCEHCKQLSYLVLPNYTPPGSPAR